jgi:quercetin dioxygenase-like cupin family protein
MRREIVKPVFLSIPVLAVAAILGVIAMAVSVGTVLATSGSGITREDFSVATLAPFHLQQKDFHIRSDNETDVVMRKATIAEDGHSGWHTHPGPTIVTVAQGQVRFTRYTKNGCVEHVAGPGEGFVEPGNEVHIAENVGTGDAVLYVTFLNVPVGGATADSSPEDPGC